MTKVTCMDCGWGYEESDAHFGISHYPFYRSHIFRTGTGIQRGVNKITPASGDGTRQKIGVTADASTQRGRRVGTRQAPQRITNAER